MLDHATENGHWDGMGRLIALATGTQLSAAHVTPDELTSMLEQVPLEHRVEILAASSAFTVVRGPTAAAPRR